MRIWCDRMCCFSCHSDEILFLREIVFQSAKDKIEAYDGFTKGFLPGFLPRAGTNSALSMLETGEETSIALRKMIASYLGVPPGSDVPMLRRAVSNLKDFVDNIALG